jgi:tetratricopeptide (TPR) repeat protein
MDRRWTTRVLGCALAGAIGCAGPTKWMSGKHAGDDPPPEKVVASKKDDGKESKAKPETYVALGDVKAQAGLDPTKTPAEREMLYDQARQEYQKALASDARNVGAMRGLVRLYVQIGDRERAQAAFQRLLKETPKDPTVWHDQGIYLVRQKDWPAAVESLKTACQLDPDNRIYCKTLGFTLAWAGQPEEGLFWLCKAMPEPQARLNVAKVLHYNHQDQACEQQLEMALRSNPQFADARQMLEQLRSGQPDGRSDVQQTAFAAPAEEPRPSAPRALPIQGDAVPQLAKPPVMAQPEEQPSEPVRAAPVAPVLTADWDNRPAPMPKKLAPAAAPTIPSAVKVGFQPIE